MSRVWCWAFLQADGGVASHSLVRQVICLLHQVIVGTVFLNLVVIMLDVNPELQFQTLAQFFGPASELVNAGHIL